MSIGQTTVSAKSDLKTSIIIIVKNDRGIANTLVSLQKIDRPTTTEILVIDASPQDYLDDIKADHPEVTWMHYEPKANSKKSSIPEQRNLGVANAQGDIIVFIDANCVPEKTWLSRLLQPIVSGEESIVAGSTLATNPKTLANFNPSYGVPTYRTAAPTVNLAFTRQVFDAVGGFDESLHFGSDYDFSWRSAAQGYCIRYESTAVITHDWGTTKDELKRSFKYGRAKYILYRKHPERINFSSEDMFVPMYLAYLVMLPITIWFFWYPLVIMLPMLRNLKSRPFKTAIINCCFSVGFAWQAVKQAF